jgi:hypothetical protein
MLVLLLGQINGQTITFNKRFKVSCSNTILTGLEVTDSCHYITGLARDTANCHAGGLFMRIDSLGEVLDFKVHLDSTEHYEMWEPCLRKDVDGNFVVAGDLLDTGIIKVIVVKYDSQGNILWKKT